MGKGIERHITFHVLPEEVEEFGIFSNRNTALLWKTQMDSSKQNCSKTRRTLKI